MWTTHFLRGGAFFALLLAASHSGTAAMAQTQKLSISSFHFGSVGGNYPVDTRSANSRNFSLQGGGGQTFSTVEKPRSAQFGVKGGFAQTKARFAYKGHIEFGDFLNRPPFNLNSVRVHIRIHSGLDGSLVDEQDGYTDANGDFTLYTEANPAPLIDGEPVLTQISAKASHWLRRRLIPAQPDTPVGYPSALFSLINGDANGDNRVDTEDNVFVAHHIQSRLGEPKYHPDADLNGDGIVSPLDLQIVHEHRRTQGDD